VRAVPRAPRIEGRGLLTLLLIGAVGLSALSVPWGGDLVHPGGGSAVGSIVKALARVELSPEFLRITAYAAWTTLRFAVAGVTLALAIGLPLGVVASGVLTRSGGRKTASIVVARFVLALLRSIHELVWAWLFVVAIGLSPMAVILALALPYAGILGRVFADALIDVPEEPLRALRSAGASEIKLLVYGRLTIALPDMLGYGFYRFECAIRSAAIFSFVGVQGLGYQIQLSLDDLLWNEVWTLLIALAALVLLVDAWSSQVRRRLVS
jgi:phosphonate transport system permease protein